MSLFGSEYCAMITAVNIQRDFAFKEGHYAFSMVTMVSFLCFKVKPMFQRHVMIHSLTKIHHTFTHATFQEIILTGVIPNFTSLSSTGFHYMKPFDCNILSNLNCYWKNSVKDCKHS